VRIVLLEDQMTNRKARKIILGLIEAGYNSALVPCQDGGEKVDVVWSILKPDRPMELREAELLMDAAICIAWEALTGKKIPNNIDPVAWINSANA